MIYTTVITQQITDDSPDDLTTTSNTIGQEDFEDIGDKAQQALACMHEEGLTPKNHETINEYVVEQTVNTVAEHEKADKRVYAAAKDVPSLPGKYIQSVDTDAERIVSEANHKANTYEFAQPRLGDIHDWENKNEFEHAGNRNAIRSYVRRKVSLDDDLTDRLEDPDDSPGRPGRPQTRYRTGNVLPGRLGDKKRKTRTTNTETDSSEQVSAQGISTTRRLTVPSQNQSDYSPDRRPPVEPATPGPTY